MLRNISNVVGAFPWSCWDFIIISLFFDGYMYLYTYFRSYILARLGQNHCIKLGLTCPVYCPTIGSVVKVESNPTFLYREIVEMLELKLKHVILESLRECLAIKSCAINRLTGKKNTFKMLPRAVHGYIVHEWGKEFIYSIHSLFTSLPLCMFCSNSSVFGCIYFTLHPPSFYLLFNCVV